jgi:hypothetical protein
MRKLTMLVALVAIFSLALAAPALAQPTFILGPGDNIYNERRCPPNGDEEVRGRAGDDQLFLNDCGDTPPEPNPDDSDADRAFGGRGGDRIHVNDGDIQDLAAGGRGFDACHIDRDLGADNQVGGTGPNEDVQDQVRGCERVVFHEGDFYTQT